MANLGKSDVHYYLSTMTGAPESRYLAGSIIGILDACLIDGFGDQAPQGGWEKVFSGTNKAAYRSLDVDGTRLYLRVDDTPLGHARIVGYETMSDVDTGTGPFPTAAQFSGGMYISNSGDTNFDPRKWTLFADNRAIYFYAVRDSPFYDYGYQQAFFFGDIINNNPDDAYQCAIIGQATSTEASRLHVLGAFVSGNTSSYIARDYTQLGESVLCTRLTNRIHSYIGQLGEAYPSPIDGKLKVFPISCFDTGDVLRGEMPGQYSPSITYGSVAHGTLIDNVRDYPERTFFIQSASRGNNNDFRAAIDITGPWRDDGTLGISGKVTELSVPGAYQVNLFRQSDMQLLQTVWSDENGDYAFTNLKNQKYVVVAVDHTAPLRTPAIKDNVIPS